MAKGKKKQQISRSTWKDYFSFNNRVRRGLMVLLGLISAEIIALVYLHYLPASAEKMNVEKFKSEVDAFYNSLKPDPVNSIAGSYKGNHAAPGFIPKQDTGPEQKPEPELFAFNPNHLPVSDWKRLGFSEKQIRSIHHYEEKGGTFRTKADVKKMYAIRDDEFSRIEPYITIPEKENTAHPVPVSGKSDSFLMVDIGTADSTELDKLPMIGAYLSQKIFYYREKLGGFYSVSQLKEVKGLRDSAFLVVLPHLILKDSANLRRINLNTADYRELSGHPYISSTLANIILNYRKQHGAFSQVDDLHKVALVDGELYRKIAPYLKVE